MKGSLLHRFLVAIALGLALPSGCNKGSEVTSGDRLDTLPKSDNVVFLVIDTLRADHLPFYGYPKDTAPFLTKLASQSVVFENAFAASSYTAPSMASVFTSLYPTEHGVTNGMRVTAQLQREDEAVRLNRIPEGLLILGEVAKARGYSTIGVADNLNINREMGFLAGFDVFQTLQNEGAKKVNESVMSYDGAIRRSPSFTYIHYMDPHDPYLARAPYFDPNAPDAKVAAYDSEIRYADEHIRALFEHFQWMKNSLIVFMADHGEEFGDHGRIGHARTLYPEVIRVPLMVYHRNLKPRRNRELVHLIDVLPTLIELFELQQPEYMNGRSFVSLLHGEPAPARDLVYAELMHTIKHGAPPQRAALSSGPLEYIRTFSEPHSEMLFELETDPTAQRDLGCKDAQEKRCVPFRAGVDALAQSVPPSGTDSFERALQPDEVKQLKTLGYMQ